MMTMLLCIVVNNQTNVITRRRRRQRQKLRTPLPQQQQQQQLSDMLCTNCGTPTLSSLVADAEILYNSDIQMRTQVTN